MILNGYYHVVKSCRKNCSRLPFQVSHLTLMCLESSQGISWDHITAHNFFLPTDLRMSPRYWKPHFSSFLCLRQFEHVSLNFKRGLRPQVYIAELSEFLDYNPSKVGCATWNLTVQLPRGAGKSWGPACSVLMGQFQQAGPWNLPQPEKDSHLCNIRRGWHPWEESLQ